MDAKLKIAVITQNDIYAIPHNVKLLFDADDIEVSEVVVIKAGGSLENKRMLFIRGFGVTQAFKMAMVTMFYHLRSFFGGYCVDLDVRRRWFDLKRLCGSYDISYRNERDVNGSEFLKRLEGSGLDVIVSFSAPTVFRAELLNLPRYGCINLHCSALPAYSGVLPSFWVLFHDEKKAAASVHLMDSKIDNGAVLGQEEVDISDMDNMLEVIKATKSRGGHLMLQVLRHIHRHNNLPHPIDTSHNEYSYFSWPEVDDLKKLMKDGKRLI